MDRPRTWNFKQVTLHGMLPEINARMPKRPNCPVCGTHKALPHSYHADDRRPGPGAAAAE